MKKLEVSRRRFLQNGAVAAAALVAAPLPAWSGVSQRPVDVNPPGHRPDRVGLGRAAFESAVGSAFQVSPGGANSQPVWLTLLKVEDLPALAPMNAAIMAVPPPKTLTSVVVSGFVLIFRSSAPPLAQGTYIFQHETLGKFNLFVVPGAPGTEIYSAVFNTLVSVTTTAPSPPRFVPPRFTGRGSGTGSDNVPSSIGAAGSSSGSAGNTGGSPALRPAQEQLEPVFRDRLEPKLPE